MIKLYLYTNKYILTENQISDAFPRESLLNNWNTT